VAATARGRLLMRHFRGPVDIESKALLGFRGDLNRIGWIRRRAVCDGQDQHLPFAVFARDGDNDGARPGFCSIFAPLLLLAPPEIGIADDQTGIRFWKRHGFQSLISLSRSAYRSGTRALRMAST
jgi:hypothetical protein